MSGKITALSAEDDVAVQVLSNEGAQCGDCGDQPGDRICPACERCRRWYVAALRAAGWAPRLEVLGEAVQAAQGLGYIEHAPEHGWSDQHDAWDGGRGAVVDLLNQMADQKTP